MLVLLLVLLLLPTILMSRGQKKRQQQVQEMQASIRPGDKIVNVAGFHGTVVANNGEVLQVELAPGTVVEMEVAGVMKKVDDPQLPAEGIEQTPAAETDLGDELPGNSEGGSNRL